MIWKERRFRETYGLYEPQPPIKYAVTRFKSDWKKTALFWVTCLLNFIIKATKVVWKHCRFLNYTLARNVGVISVIKTAKFILSRLLYLLNAGRDFPFFAWGRTNWAKERKWGKYFGEVPSGWIAFEMYFRSSYATPPTRKSRGPYIGVIQISLCPAG